MPEPLASPATIAVFAVFFCLWFGNACLMIARPQRWVDWFLRKPYKAWGIAVVIEDEQKLRKWFRVFGLIYAVAGALFLAAFLTSVFSPVLPM
jgi:hypothetical protein